MTLYFTFLRYFCQDIISFLKVDSRQIENVKKNWNKRKDKLSTVTRRHFSPNRNVFEIDPDWLKRDWMGNRTERWKCFPWGMTLCLFANVQKHSSCDVVRTTRFQPQKKSKHIFWACPLLQQWEDNSNQSDLTGHNLVASFPMHHFVTYATMQSSS